MTNRIRVFLAVEAAAFFLAASVHAGLTLHGFEHQKACIAESVIGVVLAAGLLVSFLSGQATRVAGITVQAFALLGTLVGVFTNRDRDWAEDDSRLHVSCGDSDRAGGRTQSGGGGERTAPFKPKKGLKGAWSRKGVTSLPSSR